VSDLTAGFDTDTQKTFCGGGVGKLCQRYGTTGGINQMQMHNGSESGHGAWVALCAHPTHTDTQTRICGAGVAKCINTIK
jgi:hypothetical protein